MHTFLNLVVVCLFLMIMSLAVEAQDRPTASPWPPSPPVNKIDTHHHWVPPEYAKAISDAGGDPSGWPTPLWSLDGTETLMNHSGIKTAILSITAPGATILEGSKSWELARLLNEKAATIRDSNPQKFGFFLSLANILDTEAALVEIAYAFDVLKADGVCLFSRYGDKNTYLGNLVLLPIWEELNRRKAIVFLHPTHPVDTSMINSKLPQPLVDYPHETTKAAMDMLTSCTLQKFPDVKVILSHAGGTLPYLIGRVLVPLRGADPAVGSPMYGLTYDQITRGFRAFYFDMALSTSPGVLNLLIDQVPLDHILYGSDFPYAPPPAYPGFLKMLEELDLTKEQRDKINFGNALTLIPRLSLK